MKAAGSTTVTIYVDQVPLPYLAMTPAAGLDVERVEALKWPKGMRPGELPCGAGIVTKMSAIGG